MMLQERLPYRICVGMMLLNHDGLVFVGRRRNKRQREHVAPGYEWQMPQGGIDSGEEPYQAALRELREETGLQAAELTHLGRLHAAYGYSSQSYDVFVATGLTAGDPQRESTEQDMIHRWQPATEIRRMIADGELRDAHSVAALALYDLRR